MKFKNIKLFSCLIAVSLVLSFVPSLMFTVSANDSTPTSADEESYMSQVDQGEEQWFDEETIYEETTEFPWEELEIEDIMDFYGDINMEPMSPINNDNASINGLDQPLAYEQVSAGTQYLSDGVYSLENYGNDNFWASVLDNSSDPDGYAVQTNVSTNPVQSFTRGMLFKISRVGTTNRYVIRSMLNNRIGLALVGNVVRTKELPTNDSDVAASDTFVITPSGAGYTIAPYGTNYIICSPNNTNSGTSTAKIHRNTAANAGDRAIWMLYQYTGERKSGINLPITATNWNYGAKVGETYTIELKTWTTEVGANTPYLLLHPNYTDMATVQRINDYKIKVTPTKVGPIGIRSIIRRDGTTTSFLTYKSVYSVVPEIDGENAVIKNIGTGKYIDISSQSTSSGAYIQQDYYNGMPDSRWNFDVVYGGFFYIKSLHSSMYIGVDSSSTTYVKQYSAQSDYTLWRFNETTGGNYSLACKATESGGTVLSAPTSQNGEYLRMAAYTDNTDYRDELLFYVYEYTSTVNNYFDKGYMIRYSETEESAREKINGYSRAVAEVYLREIGLLLMLNDAQYYHSAVDECKGTVTSDNIDDLCQHSAAHTERRNMIDSFISDHSGSTTLTTILWSGHKISSTASSGTINYNRSCSYGNSVFIIKLLSDNVRTEYSQGVVLHELNHQYGAPDHYHEPTVSGDDTTCKFIDICSTCDGPNARPLSCIMFSSRQNIFNVDIICYDCKQDILAHLEGHHKN